METVEHGDSWWRQGDDGTWYRWDEQSRSWQYADPAPPMAAPAAPPAIGASYQSPRGLARVLTTLLGTAAVLDLAVVAVFFSELRRWDAALGGPGLPGVDPATGDVRLGLLGVALLAVLLATIPLFIAWFHRLYRNLPSVGATGLRFGPGWTIGAWFVPLLNLWRPKQIANDIWRASDPSDTAAGTGWRGRPVAAVVHLWWALYLLSNLANQAVVRLSVTADGGAERRTQALAEMGAAALDAVTAVVAMWFVTQMTARQEQRATLLRRSSTSG